MIIQSNLSALHATDQMKLGKTRKQKNAEKLSSGYKINRAADDAAGLTISEKMRSQIRGLTQASLNAQDGISMIQTAEGALNESHEILQRMNELCVKAANDTNASADRDAIQLEISALIQELDRISTSTNFNEKPLLTGMWQEEGKAVGAPGLRCTVTPGRGNTPAKVAVKTPQLGEKYTFNGSEYTIGERTEDIYETDPETGEKTLIERRLSVRDSIPMIGRALDKANQTANKGKDYSVDVTLMSRMSDPGEYLNYEVSFHAPLSFVLQVGAQANQTITVYIDRFSASALGVANISVRNQSEAGGGIESVNNAIQKVSKQRSELGAYQNRLEHTIRNLDNVVENTTAAESGIRDTEMAGEYLKYSKENILENATQAILGQANHSAESVLALLGQ